MPDSNGQFPTLHERTIQGVRQLFNRVMNHVSGLERTIISRGAGLILPRVEDRVRRASEAELRQTLKQLRGLIDDVLGESKGTDANVATYTGTKRKTRRSQVSVNHEGSRKRMNRRGDLNSSRRKPR